jgi:hypothetical protein
MKNLKFILLLVIIFISISCNKEDSFKIDSVSLFPKRTIEKINDTTFFSRVRSIKYNNGKLFISDYKGNRVLCTDTAYNLLKTFGQTGNGPGDLINPVECFIDNQFLYVFQQGNLVINKYQISNTKFVKSIPIKFGMHDKGFIILNDSIYSCFYRDEFPISIMDTNGLSVKSFGSKDHILNLNQGFSRVFMFEYLRKSDKILAFCENEPVIEKYTTDGKLINTFNFSNYEPFYGSIISYEQLRQKPENANATFSFVQDTFTDGDYIYLLLYSYNNEKGRNTSNTIMQLKVSQNGIIPIKNLILSPNEELWFTAFTVYSNKLVAFNSSNSEIVEYYLPD